MKIKQLIDLLNEAIGYAEEAIDEIESKETKTSNEDRRLELAKQFIANSKHWQNNLLLTLNKK